MKALGKHLVVEFYGCRPGVLDNKDWVEGAILRAVEISGATVIHPFFHQFSPHGISGVVVIAESHFAIHTWPEYGYAAVDIFTCGDDVDGERAVEFLYEMLEASSYSVVEIKRGLLGDVKHKPDG